MPSVRYVPTGTFRQHSSGTRFERIRFIIIDDDSTSVFSPRNLSAHFGSSERLRRYRIPQPGQEEEKSLTGSSRSNNTLMAPVSLINGKPGVNQAKGSHLHASVSTNSIVVGGQGHRGGRNGRALIMNIHSCYHQSQVSNITKFVCWSHGSANGYIPEIAVLFKQGEHSTAKFDWQKTPHATVFKCNDYGTVEKLVFGDESVSGLECVLLGEPIGNYEPAPGDGSKFISLIPGSNRADQILESLMDKNARDAQRPQWDADCAIISSSQDTDDGVLMMKDTRKLRANRHAGPMDTNEISVEFKASAGLGQKQLARKPSGQVEVVTKTTNSSHRSLTWLHSGATKVASLVPGGPPKGMKDPETKEPSLAPVAPTRAPVEAVTSPQASEELKKLQKAYEKYPKRSRAHHSHINADKNSSRNLVGVLGTAIAMSDAGNNAVLSRDRSFGGQTLVEDAKIHEGFRQIRRQMDDKHSLRLLAEGTPTTISGSASSGFIDRKKKKTLVVDVKQDPLELASAIDQDESTALGTPASESDLPPLELRTSKSIFDLSKLPDSCVRESDLSYTERAVVSPKSSISPYMTSTRPDMFVGKPINPKDPVFRDCKVVRGFEPLYPSDMTPKTEFQNRVGGLEAWEHYPMVQIAREYLPVDMRDTDWSWTDNDVCGEFIPGGLAW